MIEVRIKSQIEFEEIMTSSYFCLDVVFLFQIQIYESFEIP